MTDLNKFRELLEKYFQEEKKNTQEKKVINEKPKTITREKDDSISC